MNVQFSLFLNNENGFALLSSMLFLVILTVIGIAATNTSSIETMIAGAEKNRQRAFFAAEAGIEHCTAILMDRMSENYKKNSLLKLEFCPFDLRARSGGRSKQFFYLDKR